MLDSKDRRILDLLQADGRMTTRDLAARINLSQTAVAERIRKLTRDGYISGYGARLDPTKLGLGLLVFVEIKLERTTPDVFEKFTRAVRDRDEVLECHMVAGGFDYLIKARVADMEAWRAFLTESILSLPGVRETHTFPVMEEVKEAIGLPVG